MTDDPVLQAVQRFMDAVEERLSAHTTEIRGLLTTLETRAASLPTEGPPGKDGKDGVDGKNGIDGKDGKDGTPGERGADGIATVEQIEAIVEQRAAAFQSRTLADAFQGVYDPSKTYTRGQLVVWGGQTWLSMDDAKERARPGESPEWRLLVKKGADGKR